MTTKASVQTEAYSLPRDGNEKARLISQHALIADLNGGLIHPSIPVSGIREVADIATGTGIWLTDVAKRLNNPDNVYHGFDLSPIQFPQVPADTANTNGNFEFIQHNMLNRFPDEYHRKFDLVNIRLVVQGIKAAEVKLVISNVAELLRPGGYIQWGDVEWDDVMSDPPHEALDRIDRAIVAHMKYHGLSGKIAGFIEPAMREAGFRDVVRTKMWAHEKGSQSEVARVLKAAEYGMLPRALETVMIVEEKPVDLIEIDRAVLKMKSEADRVLESGHVWTFSFAVVAGRKSE
ncbi:S-adenosyl-L-methionine-dependent methyltransferase [Xylogone sp. PMI_703]|nr:S-adenosyl-L-methionine-dependent methyltransferase [Xylogone sp. PMI_703]